MKVSLVKSLKNLFSEIREKLKVTLQTTFEVLLETDNGNRLRISWKIVIIINTIVLILIVKLLLG